MDTPESRPGPRHRAEPGANRKPLTIWGKIGMTIIEIASFIVIIGAIWGGLFPWVGKEWVTCHVEEVDSGRVGSVGATIGWAAILETSNCGNVAIFNHLKNDHDAQQFATTFTPGDTVELHMGYFDRNISRYILGPRNTLRAFDYRLITHHNGEPHDP